MAHETGSDPCRHCGACCARFRVSFYWAEGEALPDEWVERITPTMACMSGTNHPAPHCAALQGAIGDDVRCVVYENRPSPCREVQPGDERCNQARRHYQLPPLG